jgi:FAD-dependent urate hydroxylase
VQPGHSRRSRSRSGEAAIDALITDAAQRQGLVALRDLGRASVRICAVDRDPHTPAFASHWCDVALVVPDFVRDPNGFVDRLLQVCAERRPRALIPVHDGSVEALRARRTEVERVVGLALGHEDALAIAVDKAQTLAIAETLGMRVPRGVLIGVGDDMAGALDEVGCPAVVKPTHTWVQTGEAGRRLSAVLVSDRAEALSAIRGVLEEGTAVMLQEWLPGDREALSFFYAQERVWARFAQRADRTYPPLGGNSVLRESIPLPQDVTGDAERLIMEIGLDGYSEVEFRRDADGRPALMEINPRLSASVEIAVRAGVSFPRLLYAWAAGERLQAVDGYRTGRRIRWLGGDLQWLEEALRQPDHLDVPPRMRAVSNFFADFLRPMSYDYLDRRDLRPALSAMTGAAQDFKQRIGRRVGRQSTAGDGIDTDVAVIGAGPYGLAVSAHLKARGVRHEIFGNPMDTWRNHMPAGMYLKSEGFASNISDPGGEHTLERYCTELGLEYGDLAVPISLERFVGYGDWFQERAVPQLRMDRIDSLSAVAGGFQLGLRTGETLRAARVVLATGMQGYADIPTELQSLPPDVLSHSYDYTKPSQANGADVAVVGAGQSALEVAALLHEQGANVTVIVRDSRVAWNSKPGGSDRPLGERLRYPASGLGEGFEQYVCANHPLAYHAAPQTVRLRYAFSVLGPAGSWWLRPRIENKVEVLVGHAILDAQAQDGRAQLRLRGQSGVKELSVAHVVAGTGYRVELSRLPFLDRSLSDAISCVNGNPVLNRSFESTTDGLYFVGHTAAASFGPLMRFVFGTDFTARRVASAVAQARS